MSFFERLFGGNHGGRHGGRHHQADEHRSDGGGSGVGYSGGMPRAGGGATTAAGSPAMCPSCKTPNAAGARFCQHCGVSLVAAACTQCGAALQRGAKFCGSCARAVGA